MYVHIYKLLYCSVLYLYGTIIMVIHFFQNVQMMLISSKNSRKIIIKILDAVFKLLDYQYSTNIIFIIYSTWYTGTIVYVVLLFFTL